MPQNIKPPKKTAIYAASKLKFNVMPAVMINYKAMMITTEITHTLNEAPISDKIYAYNGKNYGRPKFELLSDTDSKGVPGQKGFQFTKDNNDDLHLNIIVKAFHSQQNVIPLDYRTVTIELQYEGTSGEVKLPLEIIQSRPVQQANVLKHIYAHAIIKNEDKEAIYEALVNLGKTSKLVVKAAIWWQKPAQKPVAARPVKPKPVPIKPKPAFVADVCTKFDYRKLIVKGNLILSNYKGNSPFGLAGLMRAMKTPFMKFRTPKDAIKALNTIKYHKLDRKCSVGNQFTYFLSGNNPPTRKMNGENCKFFTLSSISIENRRNNWCIVDKKLVLFNFGKNKTNANKALQVIKKHSFDTICTIGVANMGMTYLKRTKPVRLQTIRMFNPQLMASIATHIKPILYTKPKTPTVSKPQKIEINNEIYLSYERNDATIFQGFFDELESKEYKWQQETKIDFQNPNTSHSYYFRLTNDPNKVFFLPQVYRIGVNPETGEPKMYINLYEHENENGSKEYRINMTFHVEPYFHPRAKKDLMNDLNNISNGNIKYVDNLVLGGYQNVSFKVEERFLSEKVLFTQKITETLGEIEPSGFTITADHNLESFDVFKKELLTNGINIGKIYFDLEQETQDGVVVERSKPINVELNFKKLKNIPITVESLPNSNNGNGAVPSGFYLNNKTNIPVTVEGVELTLLSTDGNFIYDVDSSLDTTGIEWPLEINAVKKEGIFINENDIDELSVENMVWNSLVCEPYGMRANINPEQIMASVIDHATGDSQMWKLHISSPLYENWNDWSEEEKEPYNKIKGVIVEIKKDNGEVTSVKLNRENPKQVLEMASTVQQMLQNTNQENRKYEYRITNITLQPSAPGVWKNSENTSIEHLLIYPEI